MIPRDKLLHVAAGALTGLLCFWSLPWSLVLAVILAFGKEARDKWGGLAARRWPWLPACLTGPGTAEFADILATLAGWAVVAGVIAAAA